MQRIQKLLLLLTLTLLLLPTLQVKAQFGGILPSAPDGCGRNKYNVIEIKDENLKKALDEKENFLRHVGGDRKKLGETIGCALKVGKIRLYMIPYFVTFLIQFLLSIAGLIAVLFVVIGGYQYVVGGVTEDKEKGKKTIQQALIGLVVSLSAWIIVNFIQIALTS